MRKLIYQVMIFALMLFSSVFAMSYNATCNDTNTLYEETKIYHYIDGSLDSTEIWNQTITCRFGCDEGRCINENLNFTFPLIIAAIGISLGFFSFKMDKEHAAMQLLFMSLSLMMLMSSLSIANRYVEVESSSSSLQNIGIGSFSIVVWAFRLFVLYFIIIFIWNLLLQLSDHVSKRRRK